MPPTVLVCGSRDWAWPDAIEKRLIGLPLGSKIISGGARGADEQAATIARRLGFEVTEYPADWRTLGRRAGVLRNLQMLDLAPDLVLAFRLNGSTGTGHVIAVARERGIPFEVVEVRL